MFTYSSKVEELRDWLVLRDSSTALAALEFAEEAHKGQWRSGGIVKYIEHPAEVALIAIRNGFIDAATISAAILHDVIEDCGITYEELKAKFGVTIASTVQLLSKTREISWRNYLANILNDRRASRIKLIDRLHNLRSMSMLSEEKQEHYRKMTSELFYPFIESCYQKYPYDEGFFDSVKDEIKKIVGD